MGGAMRLLRNLFVLLLMSLLVSACVTYSPSERFIGMSREQVIAAMGRPYPLPNELDQAQRLDFPRGPSGKHTYRVQFDTEGKASSYQQLLNEENFRLIKPGMDVDEVIDLIGMSRDSFGLARNRGYVWNYRYFTPICRWFQIEFTAEHKVRSSGYGLPIECRPKVVSAR